jgi:DNA (cytosine-5)-methyltransferase 1
LFSANECKQLMGFPKDFKMPVSRTQMYRQTGNSVSVPVVTAIARKIRLALEG